MGETLIVCPCWFIAIERLYWKFKLYCTTFFSKMCASKFGVRLIYGCGLYMDVYGTYSMSVIKNYFIIIVGFDTFKTRGS